MKLHLRALSLLAVVIVTCITFTSCNLDALIPSVGEIDSQGCVHQEKSIIEKQPTCTESGLARFECVKCGVVTRTTSLSPKHEYGEIVVLEKSTCSAEGKAEHTCTLCGFTESGPLQREPHTPDKYDVCTVCEQQVSAKEICEGRYDPSAGALTMFSVYLARGTRNVKIGETVRMDWSGYPYVTSSRVQYRSTNSSVATVDQYGEITGVGYGTCCIVATVPGTTLAGHISVAVSEDGSYDAPGYPFTVSPDMAYLPAGTPAKITITLAYEFYPESITVTASNPSQVSITYGERNGLTQEVTVTPLCSTEVLITVKVGSYTYDVGYWNFG